jgi:preprotein translocase subunit SecG
MQPLIMVIHILASVSIVVLVLIQHGKGADVGAAFGSGASNTVFGSRGSTSFMFKMTAIFATIFFITSITLSYIAANRPDEETALELVKKTVQRIEEKRENAKATTESPDRERGIPSAPSNQP